jgi:predicted AAA+ superfamily ATPase
MATVTILKGKSRGKTIRNQTFTLLQGLHVTASGKNVITVDGTKLYGRPKAQIVVKSEKDFTVTGEMPVIKKSPVARRVAAAKKTNNILAVIEDSSIPDVETNETDKEVLTRINRRFEILGKLTLGARRGDIRAMFVTGAPGVGKTYNVEQSLAETGMIDKFENSKTRYEIVSGAMRPIAMYMKMYEHADANHVLVFDDCDSVFTEEESLNLLKAALDTSEKRKIYWSSESSALRKEEIPNDFEFKGSIIFISNINFRKVRGDRMRGHLAALMSRAHFLDLTVHTFREKMLRIRDLVSKGMLDKYTLSKKCKKEIMEFLEKNAKAFNSLDLRTVIKLADIAKTCKENRAEWEEIAHISLMGNAMNYE